MLKTARLFATMLTLRRFALTSAGRSQRARRASAYHALRGISAVGCFCQNRRSVEIAITRIAYKYAPMVGAGQPAHYPPGRTSGDEVVYAEMQKWEPAPTACCSMRWARISLREVTGACNRTRL